MNQQPHVPGQGSMQHWGKHCQHSIHSLIHVATGMKKPAFACNLLQDGDLL